MSQDFLRLDLLDISRFHGAYLLWLHLRNPFALRNWHLSLVDGTVDLNWMKVKPDVKWIFQAQVQKITFPLLELNPGPLVPKAYYWYEKFKTCKLHSIFCEWQPSLSVPHKLRVTLSTQNVCTVRKMYVQYAKCMYSTQNSCTVRIWRCESCVERNAQTPKICLTY